MEKNSIWKREDGTFFRVLEIKDKNILMMDCTHLTMPVWIAKESLNGCKMASVEEMKEETGLFPVQMEELEAQDICCARERFTMIAGLLPFVSDKKKRSELIAGLSEHYHISRQTIRHYFCLYLAYQEITVLAPGERAGHKELSQDEKNIRWALNKYYYTSKKFSLKTAYTMLLKERYCDVNGILLPQYPSFYQFRYFYRKHKNIQNYYISRDGLKNYQRNHRPLTGDRVQEYAPHIGIGMLDATICDIYLINESGNLVGRPILTACIDGYSGLCCGYMLSWEGGVYSLRGLLLQVIANKKEWCERFGIVIERKDWDADSLPATLVTDMGSEYISTNFEQITELGVKLVNLPAYRPELKGPVEKFFDLIQDYYKPYLKGKGVIEPDYKERGAHDYRRDASLTMEQFEKIILHCILYYNTKRVVENYPYTEDMITNKVAPYAASIWEYGKAQLAANLIPVSKEQMILTLLPRTQGKFTRSGLKVNKMRYKNENFTERYLQGGTCLVAYNPDDVSFVWLVENGSYTRFSLVESRFNGKNLDEVEQLKQGKKELVSQTVEDSLQARIDLVHHIQAIAEETGRSGVSVNPRDIRKTRKREQEKTHRDYMKGGKQNA